MIATHDPETMTADEHRQEVASILAAGLLRRVRTSRTAASDAAPESSPKSQIDLDLSSKTRLSVAQQPVG